MASILFYTSIKTRVKDQESLMVQFVRSGHSVYFLNQQPNTYLPAICEKAGVPYETVTYRGYRSTILFVLFHLFNLTRFVFRHKIDVVYSHLEPANFIAVLGQYFLRARVVIVRHHLDLAERIGFDKDRSYKLTYALAKDVIAVSQAAKRYMITKEGVDASKIHHIDLGYDFKVFGAPIPANVNAIRKALPGKEIFVSVGRFDEHKRVDLSIEICKRLTDSGVACHLILLGAGKNEATLKEKVREYALTDHVEFRGYVDNVLDYLSAADWLLHPSISESSCVVVKEAGLVNLPVIVCKGIGDFDDYLVNGQNAVLVESENYVTESVQAIQYYKVRIEEKRTLGRALNHVITSRFDIKNVIAEYDKFHL